MAHRETLPTDLRPDPQGEFLGRVKAASVEGTFRVITPRMRQQYVEVVAAQRIIDIDHMAAIGERESAARGLEFGFYRDLSGQVRHVQDERADIERDAATLQAADHGLVTLGERQRDFMERRIELLERFDALQSRRMNLPPATPGY